MSETKSNLQAPETEMARAVSILRKSSKNPLWIGTPEYEKARNFLVKCVLNGDKDAVAVLNELIGESPGIIGREIRSNCDLALLKEHGVDCLAQSKRRLSYV